MLDTFPYDGHTTSLDAQWSEVPVVSLAGKTAVARAGLESSVLMDAPRFARQIEKVYREIWRQWCAAKRGK